MRTLDPKQIGEVVYQAIPKLACEKDFSLSRHHIDLNLQSIAAHTGPCQPPDNPHFILLIEPVDGVTSSSKITLQVSFRYLDAGFFLFQKFPGCLPADLS